MKGALKLVGDRHSLTDRQRLAVSRAACSDQNKDRRAATHVSVKDIKSQKLSIDGFNLIITIEAALSGGVLLLCRDGCIRDLSSVHGSYRSVNEAVQAVELIGDLLASVKVRSVVWLLDRPVSNSGRLASLLRELAEQHAWPWRL